MGFIFSYENIGAINMRTDVTDAISQGWHVYGQLIVTTNWRGIPIFTQAMVKYEEENEKGM